MRGYVVREVVRLVAFLTLLLFVFLFACASSKIVTPPPVSGEPQETENLTGLESVTGEIVNEVEELREQSEESEEIEREGFERQAGFEIETNETKTADETEVESEKIEMEKVDESDKVKTKIEELLPRFAQGVKSYSFNYRKNKYYVRGPLMKIVLGDFVYDKDVVVDGKTYKQVYLDAVYLDRGSKRAVGYCEGLIKELKSRCIDLELEDVKFPRLYADYIIKLPEDWLFEFLNRIPHLVEERKYFVESRLTTLVKFIDPDKTIELYFDEAIGLPLRVLVKQGEVVIERYDYEKLVANHVREVDVIHRSASEIPSEEVFYAR